MPPVTRPAEGALLPTGSPFPTVAGPLGLRR